VRAVAVVDRGEIQICLGRVPASPQVAAGHAQSEFHGDSHKGWRESGLDSMLKYGKLTVDWFWFAEYSNSDLR